MNTVAVFMDKAKGLTKNPLGIIALFISLIYGFACLVLSTSLNNIQGSCERLPLIWFIIAYPILILIAFIFLVVRHHEKLYAPSDYKDESNFIKTMDQKNRQKRIQNEVNAIKEEINEDNTANVDPKETQIKDNALIKENEKIVQSKYLVAESLALKAFGIDRGLSIKSQSRIIGPSKRSLNFDGVAYGNGILYGIEVKLTMHNYLSNILKQRILENIKYYSNNKNEFNINLVFIIVTEKNDYTRLEKEIQDLIIEEQLDIEIIVHSLDNLKNRFGYK
jgi:hypothetical protein